MKRTSVLAAAALCLAGCATSPTSFYQNPDAESVTSLCRALAEYTDPRFRNDVALELITRGVTTADECRRRVNVENAVITGVVIAGAAVAIGVAANNGGFGGGGYTGYGSYGVAWDQFYDQYYGLTWRCRDKATGRFVYDYQCSHLARHDHWSGW